MINKLMLDFNTGSGWTYGNTGVPGAAIADKINDLIDAGLQKTRGSEAPRTYLGASRIGEPCARKLGYEYRHEPKEPFTGRLLRIFETGHRFEDMMIEWFQAAGFDLRTKNKSGKQFGFEDMGGRIKGHIDGVLMSGPIDFGVPYPLLTEYKAIHDKSWNDLKKKGLKASKEIYFGQVQSYLARLELEACLFTALNKNTQELYHELVLKELLVAQRLSDRAVDIILTVESGGLPPRISTDPDFYMCKWCDYRDVCWKDA